MRIIIHSALWKRPKVRDIYGLGINRIQQHAALQNIEVISVNVASPQDAYLQSHREWAAKNDFKLFEFQNAPLSNKLNFGALKAREFEPDLMIFLGSDNLISNGYLDKLVELHKLGMEWAGCYGCYFLSSPLKRIIKWDGYVGKRKIEPIGTGRMIGAKQLEKMHWQPWPPHLKTSMDWHMYQDLKKVNPHKGFRLGNDLFMVDIKSETNMNSMPKVNGHNVNAANWEILRRFVSDEEYTSLSKA